MCEKVNEPGKNPKERENVELKNNENEELELPYLKDKRLR